MRFSYIDSQGKEIEVDSVESLALRIQLGAIQPETRMYDAVADRWAPAEEHPVYRSLSRGEEIDDEEVVAIGEEAAAAVEERGEEEPIEAGESEEPAESEEVAESEEPEESEEAERSGEGGDAEATEEEGEPVQEEREEVPGAPEEGEPPEEEFPEKGSPEKGSPETGSPETGSPAEPSEQGPLGLDFEVSPTGDEIEEDGAGPGDPGVTEQPAEEPSPEPGEPDSGVAAEATEPAEGEIDPGAPGPGGAAPVDGESVESTAPDWLDEGEALWQEAEGGGTGEEREDEGDAGTDHIDALEEDLADPRRKMPEWAVGTPEPEEREEEASVSSESPRESPRPGRSVESPAPRRPVHWDERRRAGVRRSRFVRFAQAAGLVLIVGAVAAYFLLGQGEEVESGEPGEEVAEPPVPVEQWTAMATAADRAWSDVLDEFQSAIPGYGLPFRPPGMWLDGIYLSNASDYPEVVDYWNEVEETVDALRARESDLYFQYLNRHLERMAAGSGDAAAGSASIPAEAAQRLVTLAREEYERSAAARDSAYQQLRDVARASLALHELLVAREEDIAYEPYSDPQVSRDPVLEAVPVDSVLRVEMNAALDRVIASINDNGIPRPITTSALFNHLLTELAGTETAPDTPPPPEPADA